jgi:hypothetical protein
MRNPTASERSQISDLLLSCSTLKCGCQWPLQPCALCTARTDPTAPRDLPDTLPTAERVALLDPGFHPVLSFPDGEQASRGFLDLFLIPRLPQMSPTTSTSKPS